MDILKTLDTYYPPPAFYFNVTIIGPGLMGAALAVTGALKIDIDAKFQEVSGINVEFNTEEVAEGGENRFKHKLPSQSKYPNLSLKRGVVTRFSALSHWCEQTLGSRFIEPIKPKTLKVDLLNEKGYPSLFWIFHNAYPVKWDVSNMNSEENKVLTETLEFSYSYFKRYNGA